MIPIKVLFQARIKSCNPTDGQLTVTGGLGTAWAPPSVLSIFCADFHQSVRYESSLSFLPLRIWNFKDSRMVRYWNIVWALKLSTYVSPIMAMASSFLLSRDLKALEKHFTLHFYESRGGRSIEAVHYSILNKTVLPCLFSAGAKTAGVGAERERNYKNEGETEAWLRNLL